MTRRWTPPPPQLGPAFTTTLGQAAGMSPSALRHPSLYQPTRGLRVVGLAECVQQRAAAMAKILEGEWAFSHLTAARLLGLPIPRRWVPDEPLHVMVATTVNRTRRPSVVGHRGLESRTVGHSGGLPVVHPAQTWVDLAALTRRDGRLSVDDLVVVADAIVAEWPTMDEDLVAEVRTRKGVRGISSLRAALPLVRKGSASAMESRARLRFLDAGLPEPELNQDVFDEDGVWLGRVDMLWRKQRVVVEYEGDQHRTDRVQWQRDIDRVRRLEAAGWKVIRMSAQDLIDPVRWASLLRVLKKVLS